MPVCFQFCFQYVFHVNTHTPHVCICFFVPYARPFSILPINSSLVTTDVCLVCYIRKRWQSGMSLKPMARGMQYFRSFITGVNINTYTYNATYTRVLLIQKHTQTRHIYARHMYSRRHNDLSLWAVVLLTHTHWYSVQSVHFYFIFFKARLASGDESDCVRFESFSTSSPRCPFAAYRFRALCLQRDIR